ncbi:hypothetical protein GGTG_05520 [Gaeumannomyces tritici R3-111a-1]|uniref:Uncharacterized protein n=1 Tax=Gaeumannomyces tritici (strain R3-111a-1) TaxID=644352 RepID=J3NW55_GAET3|nr:hypothetical protein GGTG_05520 [Gaeumannomyces tritici R3-111a-1]EJT75587.1 hypothetical protein GGTG_05520 [Gaeumannomyces tritici R3-111a-1]
MADALSRTAPLERHSLKSPDFFHPEPVCRTSLANETYGRGTMNTPSTSRSGPSTIHGGTGYLPTVDIRQCHVEGHRGHDCCNPWCQRLECHILRNPKERDQSGHKDFPLPSLREHLHGVLGVPPVQPAPSSPRARREAWLMPLASDSPDSQGSNGRRRSAREAQAAVKHSTSPDPQISYDGRRTARHAQAEAEQSTWRDS